MNLQAKDIKTSGRPFQIGVGVKGLEAVGEDLGTHFIEPPRVDSWVKTWADPTTYLVTLR